MLYKVLLQKINIENNKVEEEIEEKIQKLDKKPSNIEELDVLRKFCNQTLNQGLLEIKTKINHIMTKL
jgi:dynein heavy chain